MSGGSPLTCDVLQPAHAQETFQNLDKKVIEQSDPAIHVGTDAERTSWARVLGLWGVNYGSQLLIRGTNGKLEGVIVKLSPKQQDLGMPEPSYLFRNGTAKIGPPLSITSDNGYGYAVKSQCPSLAPYTQGQVKLTFNASRKFGTVVKRVPRFYPDKCKWVTNRPWSVEQYQITKLENSLPDAD